MDIIEELRANTPPAPTTPAKAVSEKQPSATPTIVTSADLSSADVSSATAWVAAIEKGGAWPDDYGTWLNTAFALATLGEVGRPLFHRISCLSTKYEPEETDAKFTEALKNGNGRISLGTLGHLCKEAGIQLPRQKRVLRQQVISQVQDAPEAGTYSLPAEQVAPLPTFPAEVYKALPVFLQRCCQPFSEHERAVMLLSTLGVLSGCFPTVGGLYDGQRLGLNLFVLTVGPAAAGKSALRWALALAEPHDEQLRTASKAALADYEADKAARLATRKGKPSQPLPPPPPFKMLLLPGNQSAAALYESLNDNDGRGIIGETELDTLSEALKQDWGGFSDVLRKAFHHERLALKRKGSPPLLLTSPALSLVLSGTPGQVPRLVPDAENGLFSRFWFYLITDESEWREMGELSSRPDLATYFAPLATQTLLMIQAASRPASIRLRREDWERFNQAGRTGLQDARQSAGGAGASTAFRLGSIAFRIIGVLTVLRYLENGEAPTGELWADPADVSTALALMDTARAHALAVLATLPTVGNLRASKYGAKAEQESRVKELHQQGASFREIQEQTGVAKSTASRWVR